MDETLPMEHRRAFGRARSTARHKVQVMRVLGITLVLVTAITVLVAAWALTYVRQVQATYNVLEHRLEVWWTDRFRQPDAAPRPTGAISGTVYDQVGQPLSGAVVVVSDRYGRTSTARSDVEGHYVVQGAPAGWVVPAAARSGYRDQVYDTGLWPMPRAVYVQAGRVTTGIDWKMLTSELPHSTFSVQWGEQVEVSGDYPWPVRGTRTEVTVVRDGYRVVCYLYEPALAVRQGQKLPGLVAVYPGPPLNWEPASTAFLAQGYVVLGISPTSMRDVDVHADTEDLRVAIELFAQGALSERVDAERIAALGGSFSSVALVRALEQGSAVRAVVMLGGLADPYLLRWDAYAEGYSGYEINELMQFAMWSLGRPDRIPRMYIENAAVFHVEGLPPLCLVHGTGDVVVPYTQSEQFAEALAHAGQPYELHIYETGHYPGIYEPDAATKAMYEQMVLFLTRELDLAFVAPEGIALAP